MDITDATDEPGRSNGERTYDIIIIIPDGRTDEKQQVYDDHGLVCVRIQLSQLEMHRIPTDNRPIISIGQSSFIQYW